MKVLLFKKARIRVDEQGRVCLNDIHKAAGFTKNNLPNDWLRGPSGVKEITSVIKRITGKSGNWTKDEIKSVYYTKVGASGGTWVHENLALGYAAYLSPDLAVEIRDVFLRFKRGDESLVDEIRENKKRFNPVFEQHRQIGKSVRKNYTDILKDRGLKSGFEYALCTNETYKGVFGENAKQLKIRKGLAKKDSLRDNMTVSELAYTMATEALAIERIEYQDADGFSACRLETSQAARSIFKALDSDRKNRQQRLV